jgi:hypothetical protein
MTKSIPPLAFILTCLVAAAVFQTTTHHASAELIYPPAPEGSYATVRSGLDRGAFPLGKLQPAEMKIATPVPGYWISSLKDVTAGHLLSTLKPSANWYYPLLQKGKVVRTAQVVALPRKKPQFAALYDGESPAGTQEALRLARLSPRTKKQDYEVRRLEDPSIHFHAIWLHAPSDDIFIPLSSGFGQWKALQFYSEAEMIRQLQPAALKRLQAPRGRIGQAPVREFPPRS